MAIGTPMQSALALELAGDRRMERSLRLLVDSVRDYAIFMLDVAGRVASWSPGAEAIKGYARDEILGLHFSVFYPPEEAASGKCERELELAATEGHYEEEGWRLRKDGSRFWASVVITAMRDETGCLVGFAKVTRDLTERWIAIEALRRSEERFRLLVDSVKDYAIFMLDADGRVATWNTGAERIKGYTADEVIGQHFSRFYPEEDRAAGKPERELEVAAHDQRFEQEGWRVRKDGTRFWANVAITAVHDQTGKLAGFAKITRDLSERRRLEEIRREVARAEDAVRLRDEFLSIASHELRTPLASLLLQLESLRARLADEDDVRRVDRASRAGDRLAQLVETLLDVSRIASGRFELQPSRFAVCDAVREVIDAMADSAASSRCRVALTTPAAPVVGVWDRLRVEQVVTNLLANAFRYAAGTAIDVTVAVEAGAAVVAVRDRGPGIREADLARIFGRFERGVSMRHYGGMGLGLYLVLQIAEAHGGAAGAANAPEGGARVWVRLPLAPAGA